MNGNKTHLNLLQKALQSIDLENFVDALQLMHLAVIMKSGGPFTVFAPGNLAFFDIQDNVIKLGKEQNNFLGSILQYHFVAGRYSAVDLLKMNTLQTLIGEDVQIMNQNRSLWINQAKVLRSDLLASNGVIHVVDRMLVPRGLDFKVAQSKLMHI